MWDVTSMQKFLQDPILAYQAQSEINQMSWSKCQPDWIAVAANDAVEVLRI